MRIALLSENYSNFLITLLAGSQVSDYFPFGYCYLVLLNLAELENMHRSLDELELKPDWNN